LNRSQYASNFNLHAFFCSDFRVPVFFGIILLAVLFGLDVATTDMILLLGGYEQNAIMALIINYPAVHIAIKGLAIVLITIMVQYSDCRLKGSGIYILAPVILFYSFVIYNNVTVLKILASA